MKNLIVLVCLVLSLSVHAQEVPAEASWKTSLRSFITSIAGPEWGNKLVGPAPEAPAPVDEVPMPEIPAITKKSTDVDSYTKKTKEPTAYDKLPAERKRQFDYNFIQELYLVTRRTEVKDEDLSTWLNTLDQGGSREGIYQGLVLDEVYTAMEAMDEKPTKRLTDFYINFSAKYLKQGLRPESIQNLNLYSLKRIITEKALDLIEYYEMKDLDMLYRWYANFSADAGKDYASYLQSDVRNRPSAKFHYEWAKNMPVQHVKSEFIVKMHLIMNALQMVQE